MVQHEVFRYDVVIQDSDIDIMGHVNNVSYVSWMQASAVAHSDANGWSWSRYQKLGMAWVARAHQIDYLTSAYQTDKVHVETWVSSMKKVSSTRSYFFFRSSTRELIARAETRWAFIRLKDQAPCRIPQEVIQCFSVVTQLPDSQSGE